MKNNEEKKSYWLVEYAGYVEREYSTMEEYNELLAKINKYNDKKDNKYVFGNAFYTIDGENRIHVRINAYHKLSEKMGITDIDKLTAIYEDASSYVKGNEEKLLKDKPFIGVIYFENKNKREKTINDPDRRIVDIPALFGNSIKFFNKDYLFSCIRQFANERNYGFFLDMANSFDKSKDVEKQIEGLRIAVDKVRSDNYGTIYDSGEERKKLGSKLLVKAADDLYENLIYDRENDGSIKRDDKANKVVSHRRDRDFVLFVKNYDMVDRKRYLPMYKFDDINHTFSPQPDYWTLRAEREEDFIREEQALDEWDRGIIHTR